MAEGKTYAYGTGCEDACEFLRQSSDAESDNRIQGLTALKFRYGEQWPQYAVNARGLDRPQLTINETNTYIKRVTNAQRQQRPRGKASPVDNFADKKIAKVITGLGRHVEVNSDADNAYDTAFDFAATIGWGYWRVRADFIANDSFDQDLFIDVVDNPFTVYFDQNSRLPDGSDAERALITDRMLTKRFEKEYPGATTGGFSDRGTGDSDPDWVTQNDIRLAEYMWVDRKPAKLVMLSDGTVLWQDRLKPLLAMLALSNITVKGARDSFKRIVKWKKQTAFDVLEEKELPGRFIPLVPVYWTRVVIDSRRIVQGLVKDAMDPARMVNFWQTAITEVLALAPKPKWLIAEGQDEGHENEFKNANLSATPVLRYKPTDVEGKPAPPPQRIAPEPPPSGFIEASFLANQNLSRVFGIFDPAVRGGAQHKSDKTLNAEQGQSENTNFDGYDNLTRSIKHSWRIMLDYFPVVYDTQRVMRIIGEDGRDSLVTINETTQKQDETGQAVETVLNDIRVGTYDVVMEVGPGYETKRKEGVAVAMELLDTPLGEKIAQTADDVIVRGMDFEGSDIVADRLAAANPLSQIDEKSEIPPQAQMQMKAMRQQIQQLQQQLQAAGIEIKFGFKKEEMKQDAETKRAHLAAVTKAHDANERNLSMQHSTEVKAQTAMNKTEIEAITDLLLHHMDTKRLREEIKVRDEQDTAKANENASAAA